MKLMQEHMIEMRGMSGRMMGAGGMGPGMMGQGGAPKSGPLAAGTPDERMHGMEERMDMMQMMLKQVQGHMTEMGPPPQPKK